MSLFGFHLIKFSFFSITIVYHFENKVLKRHLRFFFCCLYLLFLLPGTEGMPGTLATILNQKVFLRMEILC